MMPKLIFKAVPGFINVLRLILLLCLKHFVKICVLVFSVCFSGYLFAQIVVILLAPGGPEIVAIHYY